MKNNFYDFYFHYRYVMRNILLLKFSSLHFNTYNLTELNKIILDFSIKDLDDLLHLKLSNYFYFFRFFFGKKGVITKIKSNFELNILYHSFSIRIMQNKYDLNYTILFLLEEIFPALNLNYLQWIRSKNFYIFEILDMNIFIDKKTSIGFFNLDDNLKFKFFFTGLDLDDKCSKLLMSGFLLIN
jgi:hypothetical protein